MASKLDTQSSVGVPWGAHRDPMGRMGPKPHDCVSSFSCDFRIIYYHHTNPNEFKQQIQTKPHVLLR